MVSRQLTIVISRSASRAVAKTDLEPQIIARLQADGRQHITVISDLYEMYSHCQDVATLRHISGDIVLACWMHPRAAFWTLDQLGVHGTPGDTQQSGHDDPTDQDPVDSSRDPSNDGRVANRRPAPNRIIDCVDLRTSEDPAEHVRKLQRLVSRRETLSDSSPSTHRTSATAATESSIAQDTAVGISDPTSDPRACGRRRWYPVIDFSRCTNCLECIDFCLFGVYGIDPEETILVEQPDNCRQGCPACSRVCPEQAIIFPQHKSPTISGQLAPAGSGKLNLSALFEGNEAPGRAVQERSQHLTALPESTTPVSPDPHQPDLGEPRDSDELDELIDRLDELDLD